MARTLAWFENQCALNSPGPMQAFLHGARHHGWQIRPNDITADAAVIWSVLWAGRMRMNREVYERFRRDGRPVFVIDVGSLRRNITWKVAVNHITRQGNYGNDQDLDPDRPAKLGISLCQLTTNNGGILIAGQHPLSLQMQDWDSQEAWINYAIDQVRDHTDRPITVRPHPRSRVNPSVLRPGVVLQAPKLLPNTYDSFDLAHDYHTIVNHNSGVGIQAGIAGCAPVVDTSSLAAPVSVDWNRIEDPYDIDRQQWFLEICHTEYFVEEMAAGLCMQRLANYIR